MQRHPWPVNTAATFSPRVRLKSCSSANPLSKPRDWANLFGSFIKRWVNFLTGAWQNGEHNLWQSIQNSPRAGSFITNCNGGAIRASTFTAYLQKESDLRLLDNHAIHLTMFVVPEGNIMAVKGAPSEPLMALDAVYSSTGNRISSPDFGRKGTQSLTHSLKPEPRFDVTNRQQIKKCRTQSL